MEGTTLEKLRVVFEAQYAGYKKDLQQVEKATKQVEQAVEAETSKVNRQFNKVSTGSARKEMQKLQEQIAKQREAISAQEAVLQNLNNKYRDLMAGITKDPGTSSLEKQLAAAQKELAKIDAQLQPLLDKLTQAEEFETLGLNMPGMDEVRAQIDAIQPKYEELDDRVDHLIQQLDAVRINPEATTSAEQLQAQILLAQEKLERLRSTAAGTEQQLEQLMQSGKKNGLKDAVNGIIGKVRQLGSHSRSSMQQTHSGLDKISEHMNRLKRRMTGLAGSVLVFGLMSKALTSGRDSMGKLLRKNDEFNSSLTATQTNLKAAFMPLYNFVLPGINALMDKLEALSKYLAVFSATVFGTTYKQSKKAAEGLDEAADAADGYGEASGDLGLASFDRINNLTTSSGSGAGEDVDDIVNAEAVGAGEKFVELLGKISAGTEAFRKALKNLWKDGLTKVKNFSWTALKDFWNEFLKPFGKWSFGTQDKGLTRLVNILNEDLNDVPWEEINGNLRDFWTAIEPYAEEFGEGLIDFLEDAGDTGTEVLIKLFGDGGILPKLTDWLQSHDPETARKWGYGLGVLAASIAAFSTGSKIVTAISRANDLLKVFGGLKGLGKIALVVTVAVEGFEIGKSLGKQLNPEDAELYETFRFTGKGGFFDEVTADWQSSFDGLTQMATDFENNPVIAILTSAVAGPIPGIVGNFNKIKESLSGLQGDFETAMTGIKNGWTHLWEDAGDKFQAWKESNASKLQAKKEEFATWIGDIQENVSKFGDEIKEKIPAAFKDAFKNAANGAISLFNELINRLNEKMHLKWDAITILGQEISPAVDIQLFKLPQIPALAKGGIATHSTLAQIGEAGREAVLPLEHNTGWMQELAGVLAQTIRTQMSAGESSSQPYCINVYLEGTASKLFRVLRIEEEKNYKRTGNAVFVH